MEKRQCDSIHILKQALVEKNQLKCIATILVEHLADIKFGDLEEKQIGGYF